MQFLGFSFLNLETVPVSGVQCSQTLRYLLCHLNLCGQVHDFSHVI